MKKAVIIYNQVQKQEIQNLLRLIEEFLNVRCEEIEEIPFQKKNAGVISLYLRSESIDLLFSIDLAGFEMYTLLETYFYNIMSAKQLHFITRKNLITTLRNMDIALNLYLAVPDEIPSNIQKESTKYVPNMIVHPTYDLTNGIVEGSLKNKAIVQDVINYFMEEIEILEN